MKASYIGWIVTLSGVMFITLGHYIPEFYYLYVLCPVVGLVTSVVFFDLDYK